MGGGGGDPKGEEEKFLESSLVCDAGETRGTRAGCEVETKLPTGSMWFMWIAGDADGKKTRNGRGEDYSSWHGTATEDRKFTVSIDVGPRMLVLDGGVTVAPRAWTLPEQNAREEPKWVDEISKTPKAWGLYDGGEPSPEELTGTVAGTGPWAGTWILADKAPTITDATMYLHNDLQSGGPEYLIVDTIDTEMIEECGVEELYSIGVYALARECGHLDGLDAFRSWVVAHENRHETSLNECVRTLNGGAIGQLEAIVFDESEGGEGEVKKQAKELWTGTDETDGMFGKLVAARTTDQEGTGTDFWHWHRFERWDYGGKTGDHKGTDGCSSN